jgi:hypothetical protein
MRKLPLILTAALLLAFIAPVAAQTDTTATGPSSTVNVFFVACETTAILNFNGTMLAGEDIYYQVFAGAGATGTALTAQRRVTVDGQFAVSDQVTFNSGATVPAGSVASARVVIATEGSPSVTSFETVVDDVQDGCANPQNPLINSTDAGSGSSGTSADSSLGILIRSPFGGFINSNIGDFVPPQPEPAVVIGARRPLVFRSDTPGLIFAECDQYRPRSEPGTLYDNDNIVIFWSWYARTPEQVQDHFDKAIYNVTFQNAPLPQLVTTPIEKRDSFYWIFYYQVIGNLAPGTYGVSYNLTWSEPTFDGFEEFGPGTDNERVNSTCTFTIERNPTNAPVDYNLMYSLQ